MSAPRFSAIYRGTVRHTRSSPKRHAFNYPIFMVYLDLEELERVFSLTRWWKLEKWAPATFRRRDYLGDSTRSLSDAVRDKAKSATGLDYQGPVRMLTHLRYFGHCFNPVTFYYLHDADCKLACIVAEITNTPWKERYAYVLPVDDPAAARHDFQMNKDFHVSPFMPMEQQYAWRFSNPGEDRLTVNMRNFQDGDSVFVANLDLERRPMTASVMRRTIISYPFMTMKVVAGIYWNALRLKLKGVPFYPNPSGLKSKNPAGAGKAQSASAN
jgi:DUF1365 family protein